MLISLQVLSGKQPWSEIREDAAIIWCLANGHKPGRPESRIMDDSHWNLIQDYWSPVEERPAAEAIIPTIQRFLSYCSGSPPLRDLLLLPFGQADLTSSSLGQVATEGSSTHVTQVATEEDQNRYIVTVMSVQSIILTLRHLHLSGSLWFLMHRARANPMRTSNAAHR